MNWMDWMVMSPLSTHSVPNHLLNTLCQVHQKENAELGGKNYGEQLFANENKNVIAV